MSRPREPLGRFPNRQLRGPANYLAGELRHIPNERHNQYRILYKDEASSWRVWRSFKTDYARDTAYPTELENHGQNHHLVRQSKDSPIDPDDL